MCFETALLGMPEEHCKAAREREREARATGQIYTWDIAQEVTLLLTCENEDAENMLERLQHGLTPVSAKYLLVSIKTEEVPFQDQGDYSLARGSARRRGQRMMERAGLWE
jgi:hypothetical protein